MGNPEGRFCRVEAHLKICYTMLTLILLNIFRSVGWPMTYRQNKNRDDPDQLASEEAS